MWSQLLEPLDEEDRRDLLRRARRRRFKRNEIVFHDGDPGDTLHIVTKGHFTVRVSTPLGDTAMLRVFGRNDHFGELALIAPASRRGSVIALDNAETLSIHRDDFAEMRASDQNIDAVLARALADEVRRLSTLLVDALYVPADRRVWRRLRDLVDVFRDEDDTIVVPLTQDDLAQLAGTTRSTVNRILRSGEDDGILVLSRGKITIIDFDRLERRAR